MRLTISKDLKEILPSFLVSAYTFDLLEKNDKENLSNEISEALNQIVQEYQKNYSLDMVVNIKRIKQTRDGYKKLGKDPSHTRAACEALLRRIIIGDINIRIGTKEDYYFGINRGKINVDRLPLYTDDVAPFGNPTSDTLRTSITSNTRRVLIMLIHFDTDDVLQDEDRMVDILNRYLKIKNLNKINYEEKN